MTTDAKHSPTPWSWKDCSGAGLKIFGQVPFSANCVEFTLASKEQPLFTVAYETWIQFPPKEWDEMQRANAAMICRAVNSHAALVAACESARTAFQIAYVADNTPAVKEAWAALSAALNQAKGGAA